MVDGLALKLASVNGFGFFAFTYGQQIVNTLKFLHGSKVLGHSFLIFAML
jgi:hypothetical protein